ncbi:MAG: cystathionine beta-lyase, partial [Alphaproteobacteria bacterium]|nr:cystathionine beta-lyase [Alphaproteobacteria bacterium]
MKDETKSISVGRGDSQHYGSVNMPVYHTSTILFPRLQDLRNRASTPYRYGRSGTPTSTALEEAITALENAAGCVITPSGLSAVTIAILSVAKSGDHILVADSVYTPTRRFCDTTLRQMGVEAQYYDPLIGADIATHIRPNTSLIFTESPGSHTFEVQDIPALCAVAKQHNIKTAIDNTWGSCINFKPFAHGLDISATAATKYIVGHSDALLGVITANAETIEAVRDIHRQLGICAAPDDIYLALRGLRTLPTRLEKHETTALAIAQWLQGLSFVRRVLFPALPDAQGHDLWKRDFEGAAGLFSIELDPCTEAQLAAMLDDMAHFSMGYRWGGYESLIVPCAINRSINPDRFDTGGQYLR